MRIAVVGAGSWGTAFARLLLDHGHEVTLVCRDAGQARAIAETGRNPKYMPQVDLSGVVPIPGLGTRPEETELFILAVPSKAFAERGALAARRRAGAVAHEGARPRDGRAPVDARHRPARRGPLGPEHGRGGCRAACRPPRSSRPRTRRFAERLQEAINSLVFRIYVNPDVVGVELCAAAKNVIALAAGAVDGLGLGDNGKAALITRGLVEMARLGEASGGRPETFAGLAGMGDLIVTCESRHGRNRAAGELIARGASPDEAAAQIGQTVEGLTTAPVLRDVSRRVGVEMPITEGVCAVLEGQVKLAEVVEGLMGRRPTGE